MLRILFRRKLHLLRRNKAGQDKGHYRNLFYIKSCFITEAKQDTY